MVVQLQRSAMIDPAHVVASPDGTFQIVLEAMEQQLLQILLQEARDNYETMWCRQREGIHLAEAHMNNRSASRGDAAHRTPGTTPGQRASETLESKTSTKKQIPVEFTLKSAKLAAPGGNS